MASGALSLAALCCCGTLLLLLAAPRSHAAAMPPRPIGNYCRAHSGADSGAVPFPARNGDERRPWDCSLPAEAAKEAHAYLEANMFEFDKEGPNAQSIIKGIFNGTVNRSLEARKTFPWAANVGSLLWQQSVLPYANVNEARTAWREVLWSALLPIMANAPPNISQTTSLAAAALYLNEHMWTALGKFSGSEKITFHALQYGTPTPHAPDPPAPL